MDADFYNWSYGVTSNPPQGGVTIYRISLEDLAGTSFNDSDYNDRFWDVRVTAVGQAIGSHCSRRHRWIS